MEQPDYGGYAPEPILYILPVTGVEWHAAGQYNDAFCTGDVEIIWEYTASEEECEDAFANPCEQDLDPYRALRTGELLPPVLYDNKNRRTIVEFPRMLPFDVSIEKLKTFLVLS